MWVLEIKAWSSSRARNGLNCLAIVSASIYFSETLFHVSQDGSEPKDGLKLLFISFFSKYIFTYFLRTAGEYTMWFEQIHS